MEDQFQIQVRFQGIRPIMFDKYAGDNNTALEPRDKMYLRPDGAVCIPDLNILSMLAAENTKSVTKVFYPPKQGVTLRHTLNSFLQISTNLIPISDEEGNLVVFNGKWTDKIFVHKSVARLAKGVPNPKERPCVETPWNLEFSINWMENKTISIDNLMQMFKYAGVIGLGTFRPQFGQFTLEEWKVEKL